MGSALERFHFRQGQRRAVYLNDRANIWVATGRTHRVAKLRAGDGSTLASYGVGQHPGGMAFDGLNIWVANESSDTVSKLRMADGSVQGNYAVGSGLSCVAFDGNSIWVKTSSAMMSPSCALRMARIKAPSRWAVRRWA